MARAIRWVSLSIVIGMVTLASEQTQATGATRSNAGVTAVSADFVKDPLLYYFNLRADEAIRYASIVLQDPSSPPELRKQVLVTLATIRLAQGREAQARSAFRQMLAIDPAADLEQPERLPPPVTTLFYQLRDSLCLSQRSALVSAGKLGINIRTLAVGDIENNSIVQGRYDSDHFCKGLVHVLIADLTAATNLKIVDRQRLAVLQQEIGLSRDLSATDSDTRAKFGQLCGAQSYLFGQFMQVDRDRVRLDLRWVNTATGEIMLAQGAEGSLRTADDLFKLERKVLVEILAPQIQGLLDGTQPPAALRERMQQELDRKMKALPKKTSYPAVVAASGKAIKAEKSGNYAAAAAEWERVAKMNPADSTATVRSKSLIAYRSLPGGG